MVECELTDLPEDVSTWPRFLHGAEEAWHDLQTEHELEMEKLAGIRDRYQRSEKKKPARDCDWSSDVCSSDLGRSPGSYLA